jgi:SAM-dependent methyltransferase
MSDPSHMADFWNARAREDALFFVDDRLDYGPVRDQSDETWFWAEGERLLDELLARSGAPALPADGTALDVGCGVGRFTRVLADRTAHVHGIDVSTEMIERAKQLLASHGNVTLLQGDGTSLLPLPDASIDVAISFVVFQHIPDPAVTLGYLRELGRVLRPGGWTVFQLSNDPSVHRPHEDHKPRLRDRIRGRVPQGTDDPAWLGSAVTLEDLDEALRAGGLRSEHRSGEGTQYLLERAVKI